MGIIFYLDCITANIIKNRKVFLMNEMYEKFTMMNKITYEENVENIMSAFDKKYYYFY